MKSLYLIISDNDNHSQHIPMTIKLNKKQISEAIRSTPIGDVISKDINLTSKQRKFAENIALKGMNKTEAYRQAYNTNGKANGQSVDANKLSNNPKVSLMITQLQASETMKNLILPSSLRALAIEKITELAIDDDISPRDRLKALELIGKFTEVSLFDRMETEKVIVSNSEEVKAKLMDSLKRAIQSSQSLSEEKKRNADDLLREIKGESIRDAELIEVSQEDMGDGLSIGEGDTPPIPTPQNSDVHEANILRNIPDKQSTILHNADKNRLTPILDEEEDEGEGVSEILKVELGVDIEMTPLDDSGSPNE